VVDLFVDLELQVGLEVLVDGGLGVVAGAPWAVGEHVCGQVFDDGVEDDAVAAGGDQRGVGLEFGEDVRVGVVGVQADQDALVARGLGVHLFDDLGGDGGALDHVDAVGHGVGHDGGAVMGADVDVDAEHAPLGVCWVQWRALLHRVAVVQQREHGGAEDQRAAVGDAGFDDEVWLDLPDEFLHRPYIVRNLNCWPTHPSKVI